MQITGDADVLKVTFALEFDPNKLAQAYSCAVSNSRYKIHIKLVVLILRLKSVHILMQFIYKFHRNLSWKKLQPPLCEQLAHLGTTVDNKTSNGAQLTINAPKRYRPPVLFINTTHAKITQFLYKSPNQMGCILLNQTHHNRPNTQWI